MPSPVTSALIAAPTSPDAPGWFSIAYDPAFYQRVGMLAVAVAYAVIREDPTTTGHANRASKALQVLAQAESMVAQINLALVVVCGWSVSGSATDQQVADRLAAIWDTISGN